MPTSPREDLLSTNPSIFLRLNRTDPQPREIAWREFRDRYAPMITSFARRFGARSHEVEEIVQDVIVGFYSSSPTFVYDPAKGRFRGYLKVCTVHALRKHLAGQARNQAISLEKVSEDALEVEQVWNDVWERRQVERAMSAVRERHQTGKSWLAFEKHVVQGRAASEVAQELDLSISAVHKAKDRIGKALREQLRAMEQNEG